MKEKEIKERGRKGMNGKFEEESRRPIHNGRGKVEESMSIDFLCAELIKLKFEM